MKNILGDLAPHPPLRGTFSQVEKEIQNKFSLSSWERVEAKPRVRGGRGQLKKISKLAVAIAVAELVVCAAVRGAAPETAEFLRVPPGPRAASMGNAGVADAEGAFASFYNPALLSLSPSLFYFGGEQSAWLMDVRAAHYSFSFAPVSRNGRKWGFGTFYSEWGTEPFQATDGLGNAAGQVDYRARVYGVAVSHEPLRFLHFGLAAKKISHGFEETGSADSTRINAGAGALDAGLAWETPLPGITAGASLQNFGGRLQLGDTAEQLPAAIRAGLQGTYAQGLFRWRAEGIHGRGDRLAFRGGVEFRPFPLIGLQAGYDTFSAALAPAGFTTGFSLAFASLSMDYSFAPMGNLGAAQRIALSWRFGDRAPGDRSRRHVSSAQEPSAGTTVASAGSPDAVFAQWMTFWGTQKRETPASRGRVLLADDQDLVRHWLANSLRAAGYEVVPCASVKEALDKIERYRPDLVLLDQYMPGPDGLQALRLVKRVAPRTPVVMMIWQERETEGWEMVNHGGAAAFLPKPVEESRMLETVSRLLENSRNVKPAPADNQTQLINEKNSGGVL